MRLIPAHAGKTVVYCLPSSAVAAHPRSRGENLVGLNRGPELGGSSPLTRGKLWYRIRRSRYHGLIPAHAGKTTVGPAAGEDGGAHPRSRGENSQKAIMRGTLKGSSPLTRGKRVYEPTTFTYQGLIPAHAGKTVVRPGATILEPAHPRSRGENIGAPVGLRGGFGSSPLTRGKPDCACQLVEVWRLIPAHAGKTSRTSVSHAAPRAHPRSRGENMVQ